MTEPEEKAKELVEKFRYSFDHTDLSVILRISRKEARVHAVDTDEFKELQHLILVADSKIKTIEEAKSPCSNCKYYSFGSNLCIVERRAVTIIYNPYEHTCGKFKSNKQ